MGVIQQGAWVKGQGTPDGLISKSFLKKETGLGRRGAGGDVEGARRVALWCPQRCWGSL